MKREVKRRKGTYYRKNGERRKLPRGESWERPNDAQTTMETLFSCLQRV